MVSRERGLSRDIRVGRLFVKSSVEVKQKASCQPVGESGTGGFESTVASSRTHSDNRRIALTLASVKTSSSLSCCSVVGCSQLTVTPTNADTFMGGSGDQRASEEIAVLSYYRTLDYSTASAALRKHPAPAIDRGSGGRMDG